MRVRDLIREEMEILAHREDESALNATLSMVKTRRGSVLVVDAEGRPVGIFTERDLMVRIVAKGLHPGDCTLSEVMTRELFTAPLDEKVTTVRREMRRRHIRHLPVVDGTRIVAVLSMRDLLRADFEETRDEAAALRGYIHGEV